VSFQKHITGTYQQAALSLILQNLIFKLCKCTQRHGKLRSGIPGSDLVADRIENENGG